MLVISKFEKIKNFFSYIFLVLFFFVNFLFICLLFYMVKKFVNFDCTTLASISCSRPSTSFNTSLLSCELCSINNLKAFKPFKASFLEIGGSFGSSFFCYLFYFVFFYLLFGVLFFALL